MKPRRIALVQPRNLVRSWSGHWPIAFDETAEPEERQLEKAVACIETAARQQAEIVVFPELYPGPQDPARDCFSLADAEAALAEAARHLGLWVFFNGKADDGRGGTFNQARVLGPDGKLRGVYNKMIPASNEPNTPGTEPLLVDCDGLRVGVLICWELWYPEVARCLRLMGADLVVAPTGGILYELTENWRTILRARALENNCYVGMSVNVFGLEDGLCELAGPEGAVASHCGEGVLVADLDLERLRYLRETDERIIVPKPYRAVPGLIRWLRPEVVEKQYKAARKEGKARETETAS